jgi:hypothetical protein
MTNTAPHPQRRADGGLVQVRRPVGLEDVGGVHQAWRDGADDGSRGDSGQVRRWALTVRSRFRTDQEEEPPCPAFMPQQAPQNMCPPHPPAKGLNEL